MGLKQRSANFPVKGKRANILSFLGHMVPASASQLCSMKAALENINMDMAVFQQNFIYGH